MEDINSKINDLIEQATKDESLTYKDEWKREAVYTLNDYYQEKGYTDDEIYDLEDVLWEEIVKYNLESRGWLGVKILLEDIDNTAEYGRLDAYGNGRSVDYDLLDLLKEAKDDPIEA